MALMRIPRRVEPLPDFKLNARFWKWIGIGVGVVLAGYLTAYLILFPAPILPGHQEVPRVIGLTVAEAQAEIQRSKLQVTEGGAEPHPTAPAGVVVWQDPPPGVIAPKARRSRSSRAPARPRFRCRTSRTSTAPSRSR